MKLEKQDKIAYGFYAVFMAIVLTLALSGCGVTQYACLGHCLDEAIDRHTQKGIDEKDGSLGKCDLRDMDLLMENIRCKVKCQ